MTATVNLKPINETTQDQIKDLLKDPEKLREVVISLVSENIATIAPQSDEAYRTEQATKSADRILAKLTRGDISDARWDLTFIISGARTRAIGVGERGVEKGFKAQKIGTFIITSPDAVPENNESRLSISAVVNADGSPQKNLLLRISHPDNDEDISESVESFKAALAHKLADKNISTRGTDMHAGDMASSLDLILELPDGMGANAFTQTVKAAIGELGKNPDFAIREAPAVAR